MLFQNHRTVLAPLAIVLSTGLVHAEERDMQFTQIVPESRQIVVTNTGDKPIDLSGWRFCTHNSAVVRRYTSSSGLKGVTVAGNQSIVLHLLNDAPKGLPNHFDIAALGGGFAEYEVEAFAISLYFPDDLGSVSFGNGALIADHLQWSHLGVDNMTADERSDEAVSGGVWTDEEAWVPMRNDALLIELTDLDFGVLHGPEDYNVLVACRADVTDDGELNFFDVSAFLSGFTAQDPFVDFSGDGQFNFFDVSLFLQLFGQGCNP